MAVQIHAVCASNGVVSAATLILHFLVQKQVLPKECSNSVNYVSFGEQCK